MSTNISVFRPNAAGTVSLAVTTSTGRVQFQTGTVYVTSEPVVRLYNAGGSTVFVNFGDSSVTAAVASGFPVPAGAIETFAVDSAQTYVAAITSAGTATLYATPGYGA